ncbi:ribose 5-phosphate isomerase B [Thermodesulfobacteriota bacterium]
MDVIIGSDHAGYGMKEECKLFLEKETGHKVMDVGVFSRQSSDYPDIAGKVAKAIADGDYVRGILICGSGIGMSIAANRHRGVRAALCHNLYLARMSRQHNDANILVMGGRVIGAGLALEMVEIFLGTEFEGGRHKKRIDLIDC